MIQKLMKTLVPVILIAILVSAPYCMAEERLSSARPDPEGIPTKVSVGIYVTDLSSIDSVQQTFTPTFFMVVKWKDARLAGITAKDVYKRVHITDIWNPVLIIMNQRKLDKLMNPLDYVTVDAEGTVTYIQQYFGELVLPMELKNFPFDSHVLPITIVSGGYSPDEVSFVVDEKRSGRNDNLSIADWKIGPLDAVESVYYLQPQERDLSRMDFNLSGERYSGFYISRVIIPLILIIMMSFTVFWVDPKELGPQMGIAATSMLTLIAFQFAINRYLPRIFYLTRMDLLVLGATAIVFLALVEALITSVLAKSDKRELALVVDRCARFIFPAVFILFSGYVFFMY